MTEETKQIKRIVDDETVEQLVEGRYHGEKRTGKPTRSANGNAPLHRKKKKKKKKFGLALIITVLAFVLTFVISFLVAYTIFSASGTDNNMNSPLTFNAETGKDNDSKDFDSTTANSSGDAVDDRTAEDISSGVDLTEDTSSEEEDDDEATTTESTQKPSEPQQENKPTTSKPATNNNSTNNNSAPSNNNNNSGINSSDLGI